MKHLAKSWSFTAQLGNFIMGNLYIEHLFISCYD